MKKWKENVRINLDKTKGKIGWADIGNKILEEFFNLNPFNIPHTYKAKIFEKKFNRNLYIYEHSNFYSVNRIDF